MKLTFFHYRLNGSQEDVNAALMEDAVAYGISSAAVAGVQFIFAFISISSFNFTSLKQIARLRRLFLKSVLRQDMSWYDTHSTNNFSSKITELVFFI